jgi:hypothetical protein
LTPATQFPAKPRRWRPLLYAALLAYSLFFSWDRVRYPFAADDMMNMGRYFDLGPWRALASQFLLWQGYYRPMGAVFYGPLHYWFGLDPAPFQIAVILLLLANTYLSFHLAKALGCGELASGLAALAIAYHAGLTNLQYNVDMIYDVLCFGFFAGAIWYYIRIRGQGRSLRAGEVAVFLVLYLCALNSKEMAFTFPLVVLAYEWFYHRADLGRAWLRGPGLVIALATALDLADLCGRTIGPDALTVYASYRPVLSLGRLFEFQQSSLSDLLGILARPSGVMVLAIWALLTLLAWRGNRPALRFCWAWMLITPLPIEFLAGRTQGALYIPLAGWAIFAAVALLDLAERAAAFLARQPLLRRLGRAGLLALLLAGAVLLWARRMSYLKAQLVAPAAVQQGIQTANVIRQLQALQPRADPHSQIVFLNDPFTDWDMTFIAQLWFRDRTIHVYNQRLEHLSPADLARMDHVFDFQNGKLVQWK